MDRRAVEPDGAGAAIAGVAALLDAEDATLAQEGAQALSGLRLGGKQLAVDDVDQTAVVGGARPVRRCSDGIVHAPARGCANSARICSEK